MKRPTPGALNGLIEAIKAGEPQPPGPEWVTPNDLAAAMQIDARGARNILDRWVREGKAEKMRAPRRERSGGWGAYYRLKQEEGAA